jgi:hypothetical protein
MSVNMRPEGRASPAGEAGWRDLGSGIVGGNFDGRINFESAV